MNLGAGRIATFFLITLPGIRARRARRGDLRLADLVLQFHRHLLPVLRRGAAAAALAVSGHAILHRSQHRRPQHLRAADHALGPADHQPAARARAAWSDCRDERGARAGVARSRQAVRRESRRWRTFRSRCGRASSSRCSGRPAAARRRRLRMIAGFLLPDEGQVLLRGRDITEAPPYRRDVGLLFQNYALFPHMTVRGNVGFGPRMQRQEPQGRSPNACAGRSTWCSCSGFEDRWPARALRRPAAARGDRPRAGGRRLGRCCSTSPSPISTHACAAGCRRRCGSCSSGSGMATVHVTHDQDEAMAMSDRIVIMNAGRVEQIGIAGSGLRRTSVGVRGRVHGALQPAGRHACAEPRAAPAGSSISARPAGSRWSTSSALHACPGERFPIFIRPEHIRARASGLACRAAGRAARGGAARRLSRRALGGLCAAGRRRSAARPSRERARVPEGNGSRAAASMCCRCPARS